MTILSAAARQHIDKVVTKFPADRVASAIIPALTVVQEENGGWLTEELVVAVADYLVVPEIAVKEIATFYSMFEHQPVGKYKICLCTNISCMLRGCGGIRSYLEKKLAIKVGETTKDGKFTLKTVECLAACGGAPMMQIGKHYYENLTTEKIDDILSHLE